MIYSLTQSLERKFYQMNLVLNECKGDATSMSRNNQATGPAIAVHGSGDSSGEQLMHESEVNLFLVNLVSKSLTKIIPGLCTGVARTDPTA